MSIAEVEGYLQSHYGKEEYFATSHNERFRRQLYDVYLGGLDSEKFPLLFKRAIPDVYKRQAYKKAYGRLIELLGR